MNEPDSESPESVAARCIVCGSATCRSVSDHGVFKAQLAESLGEILLSFDPIVMYGKTVGYCFLATLPGARGELQIDSVLIGGDCGL